MTWSKSDTSKALSASCNCLVALISDSPGRGEPDGWLCTRITAFACSSSTRRRTCLLSMSVQSAVPEVSFSRPVTTLARLRYSAQHSSWSSPFSSGSIMSTTSSGPFTVGCREAASARYRRPSSRAAAMATARACPTPFCRISCFAGRRHSSESRPPAEDSSSCATLTAFAPGTPDPMKIASNSAFPSAPGPLRRSFSRGRSSVSQSFSLMPPKIGRRNEKQHQLWKTGVVSVGILSVSYWTKAMISFFATLSPCLPTTATMRPSTAETTSSMPYQACT